MSGQYKVKKEKIMVT